MERSPRNEKRRRDAKSDPTRGKRSKRVKEGPEGASTTPQIETQASPNATEEVCRDALLVVGTYHSVMAGLVLKKGAFYITFSVKHHVGCMNDVAVSAKYVASCGVDERVFLFTNKLYARPGGGAEGGRAVRLAELGSVSPPAEVRCAAFTADAHHLLCGCADGQLLVYRTRDWGLRVRLPVHAKALQQLALHPRSHGALCVTIGEDRSVAVLDLARHRLMTKWKYTSALGGKENEGEGEGERPRERGRRPVWGIHQQEEPLSVCFSPSGGYWAVRSRFSVVVYHTTTMKAAFVVRLERPQPEEELHSLVFASEGVVVVGNEAGQLLYATLPAPQTEVSGAVAIALRPVEIRYEDEQQTRDAAALTKETNARQKHPLRHTARIKSLAREGRTLFSIDSAGVVIDWTMDFMQTPEGEDSVALSYVTSANCQGRVTAMGVLALG
ncbi:unnamed protein product [Phytomonas sp. EM1]|nr:unnamed protein product [Phytomonas sp. EM1]|eukprot:CCW65425.1 unnamed protein product [Phytomonas sp. isolate EM1]